MQAELLFICDDPDKFLELVYDVIEHRYVGDAEYFIKQNKNQEWITDEEYDKIKQKRGDVMELTELNHDIERLKDIKEETIKGKR